ncbi:uncharacterized protein Dana_GF17267, isoform C [Drosophila ananassae]|uniref:Uncharacterized protein, isoform C n=1 Tax=Drosophila ananassae TaxID=7217 RepID=A0A0P9AP06_DROAN|nr:uncharacterized protein LOC6500052 isoform X3 [Drosophila ananassae]KPU79417.1 uncharacterized protein Dana_GF17267, isoform C [Drosophila ananassae]
MAFRLMTVAIRKRAPLLSAPRILTPAVPSPIVRTYFERKNLTPFWDGTTFSKKAIAHHWGAIPMISIMVLGVVAEVIAWIVLSQTRTDVYYAKDAALQDCFETRHGVWYKQPSMKWNTYNQKWEMPPGLIRAKQGDTAGPEFQKNGKK